LERPEVLQTDEKTQNTHHLAARHMTKFKVPTLLQPLAAKTPLATLFNGWLLALAHAELLTRTGRPSAARAYLQLVTLSLHRYHWALSEADRLLAAGQPLAALEDWCRRGGGKPSICVPVPRLLVALAIAGRGENLPTSTALRLMLGYGDVRLREYTAAPSAFAERATKLEHLLEASKKLGLAIEQDAAESRAELTVSVRKTLETSL
jgi:hypothetical protein